MADKERPGLPPVGRPIDNQRVYVLDGGMRLVPLGVDGELHVAGAGLARGYVDAPGLTAERFVPDPFGGTGDRLYRTGDVVRWSDDGRLQFVRRTNRQTAVRGFRVDLDQVEAALLRHPAVREAAVEVREAAPGEKVLHAWVGVGNTGVLPRELHEELVRDLPEQVRPVVLEVLPELPQRANGWVDHEHLSDRSSGLSPAPAAGAPRTPTARQLAAIWQEVLERDDVALDDNFFALGGHSLLATTVVSRVREAFQIDFPIAAVFIAQTLGELACEIDRVREDGAQADDLMLLPFDRDEFHIELTP